MFRSILERRPLDLASTAAGALAILLCAVPVLVVLGLCLGSAPPPLCRDARERTVGSPVR